MQPPNLAVRSARRVFMIISVPCLSATTPWNISNYGSLSATANTVLLCMLCFHNAFTVKINANFWIAAHYCWLLEETEQLIWFKQPLFELNFNNFTSFLFCFSKPHEDNGAAVQFILFNQPVVELSFNSFTFFRFYFSKPHEDNGAANYVWHEEMPSCVYSGLSRYLIV